MIRRLALFLALWAALCSPVAAQTISNGGVALPVSAPNGGTGVSNTGTITLAGNLVTTGAFNTTFAQGATTTVTLPSTSSTMARTDAAQTFTGIQNVATQLNVNAKLMLSSTAPTIANGGGLGTVGAIVGAANAFDVTAGTGAASVFVITLPSASNGWVCNGNDVTTHSTAVSSVQQTVGTNNATTVTMGAYSDISALAAVGTADHIRISCLAY